MLRIAHLVFPLGCVRSHRCQPRPIQLRLSLPYMSRSPPQSESIVRIPMPLCQYHQYRSPRYQSLPSPYLTSRLQPALGRFQLCRMTVVHRPPNDLFLVIQPQPQSTRRVLIGLRRVIVLQRNAPPALYPFQAESSALRSRDFTLIVSPVTIAPSRLNV